MKKGKQWALAPFAAIAVIVIAGFFVTACSDGEEIIKTVVKIPEDTSGITGVTLGQEDIYLLVGASETLSATVTSAETADKTVTWSSSKPTVATVSAGVVTGVADGIALITVTTKNGKTANCLVTVSTGVALVKLNRTAFTLRTGKTETLAATVLPEKAVDKTITWSSSAAGVASVVNGLVTAVAAGTATITVSSDADSTKTATCVVTVIAPPQIDDMIWIDPGTFMMGSPFSEPVREDYENLHEVTLAKGFYMGKYQVTQGQFEALMGFNYSECGRLADSYDDLEFYPVDSTTWYDAVAFCNALSEEIGLTPAYTITDIEYYGMSIDYAEVEIDWTANGFRLPTEAEWEYACRAGKTSIFNTGNDTLTSNTLDDNDNLVLGDANFDGAWRPYNGAPAGYYLNDTLPVGSYAPNEWGLYDMHGNVTEWCWDWFMSYRASATGPTEIDPKGPENGYYKVLRGGSFYEDGASVRSAYRGYETPDTAWFDSGFRVVLPYSDELMSIAPRISKPVASIERSETAKKQMMLKIQERKTLREGVRVLDKNSSPRKPEALRRKAELE